MIVEIRGNKKNNKVAAPASPETPSKSRTNYDIKCQCISPSLYNEKQVPITQLSNKK